MCRNRDCHHPLSNSLPLLWCSLGRRFSDWVNGFLLNFTVDLAWGEIYPHLLSCIHILTLHVDETSSIRLVELATHLSTGLWWLGSRGGPKEEFTGMGRSDERWWLTRSKECPATGHPPWIWEPWVATYPQRERKVWFGISLATICPLESQLRNGMGVGWWRIDSFFLNSVTLSSVASSNNELSSASSGGAQQIVAIAAVDNSLRVGEDGGDMSAVFAPHIHEERVWRLYQSLQLVQSLLLSRIDIEQVHFHFALLRGQ